MNAKEILNQEWKIKANKDSCFKDVKEVNYSNGRIIDDVSDVFSEDEVIAFAEHYSALKIKELQHINKDVASIPYQLCPVCNGEGRISAGNYTSKIWDNCPTCNGNRIIPEHKL